MVSHCYHAEQCLTMADHSPWQTTFDHGQPWLTIADHGDPWLTMVNHSQALLVGMQAASHATLRTCICGPTIVHDSNPTIKFNISHGYP